MADIAILGSGTWGAALAIALVSGGNRVTVWCAHADKVPLFETQRCHPKLPGAVIPDTVEFTGDIACAASADIVLFAVPSVYIRGTAEQAAPYLNSRQVVACAAKGIEGDTLFTMTDVIADAVKKAGNPSPLRLAALSGPTHAEEVAADMPSAAIAASTDMQTARTLADAFVKTCLRVYIHPDILGTELCGAAKNVMALASGIAVGLGFGDNTRAALITRGMAEIARLGTAMGCMPQTFSGLAGIGDLIVTATSMHSRNNRAGIYIGQGDTPQQAIERVGMVVEGINALPAVCALAEKYHTEMPIVSAVSDILYHGADPREAVYRLMRRRTGEEFAGTDAVYEMNATGR